MIIEGLIER